MPLMCISKTFVGFLVGLMFCIDWTCISLRSLTIWRNNLSVDDVFTYMSMLWQRHSHSSEAIYSSVMSIHHTRPGLDMLLVVGTKNRQGNIFRVFLSVSPRVSLDFFLITSVFSGNSFPHLSNPGSGSKLANGRDTRFFHYFVSTGVIEVARRRHRGIKMEHCDPLYQKRLVNAREDKTN